MTNFDMTAGMREATRLTRAGQLHEAVDLIQRTLKGGLDSAAKPATEAPPSAAKTVIEPHFRVIDRTTGAPEPHRHAFTGRAENHEHSETYAGPAAASDAHTATPPPFGTGLQKQLRRKLRAFRGPTPWSEPFPDRTPDIVPDGGRFTSGTYTNQAGTRSYKLYVPSSYRGQPLPLVVMLHGCTQNPDDFAAGTRMNLLAETHQCLVVYPAQSTAANNSACWNWFETADQERDLGEPSIIAGLTRQILDSHRVNPKKIYVAGLSAGGAMAMTMAMTYPDLYAAVGVHSGLPYKAARDLPSAFQAMHSGENSPGVRHIPGASGMRPHTTPVPAIIFHGDRDTTVHPRNGIQVIAQCAPSHARRGAPPVEGRTPRVTVEKGRIPNGHTFTRTTYHCTSGRPMAEHWLVHGAGHAWSGGSSHGSYTDPKGPDASKEMLRFFNDHPKGKDQT
jgi:poly(hydroxyalkanoate) depolymerase family esterase